MLLQKGTVRLQSGVLRGQAMFEGSPLCRGNRGNGSVGELVHEIGKLFQLVFGLGGGKVWGGYLGSEGLGNILSAGNFLLCIRLLGGAGSFPRSFTGIFRCFGGWGISGFRRECDSFTSR